MALSKDFKFSKQGFSGELIAPNAYSKVSSISGDKNNVSFVVQTFNAQDGTQIAEDEFSFSPVLDGSNFIAQAYDHLKTLPEFADAIDC